MRKEEDKYDEDYDDEDNYDDEDDEEDDDDDDDDEEDDDMDIDDDVDDVDAYASTELDVDERELARERRPKGTKGKEGKQEVDDFGKVVKRTKKKLKSKRHSAKTSFFSERVSKKIWGKSFATVMMAKRAPANPPLKIRKLDARTRLFALLNRSEFDGDLVALAAAHEKVAEIALKELRRDAIGLASPRLSRAVSLDFLTLLGVRSVLGATTPITHTLRSSSRKTAQADGDRDRRCARSRVGRVL